MWKRGVRAVRRVEVREGRVGGDVDTDVAVELQEIDLLEVGVRFELVDAGFVVGVDLEVGELVEVEV